ncbi:primosomal protein DnaI [Pseudogracilibacillus auburnensis]|uniref:Replicative DNA helicase loader DnaI n=1 Tax=Pseudogracilibacillus auburnensis TaxID=1494959 RepID=A0A2V3W970_9BACI|nr:primosomal protein DnaI [Pseudogracilibacillus auburnensis]PXW85279.1 replicative DNA helicase loader DnaI [Pseudogracilibacillus auburnensis]
MKPIQSSLQRWINDNDAFKQRLEGMKKEILNHPEIRLFLEKHPQISDQEITKRLNKLYEYITQSIQCERCTSYNACKNMLQGYSPILQYVNNEIHLSYEKCTNHLRFEKMEQKQKLIQSVYMPKEILQARMSNIYPDYHRTLALKEADDFLEAAKNSLPEKGLFFTGPFGVGKTYLLGAIANELQEDNISSMLIYMPEFVREIREAIQDNTVQKKINIFKQADVLMLDDIGAETLSAWFRDEVLGSILQYRMMEKLPVFFTSNYTMKQLENILATSTKGEVEKVKAGRIMERIKQVSKEVKVAGKNRRNE